MSAVLCRLCSSDPAIENSHVISKFVFRAIKSDSPTGFFRNPNNPNRRLQDGDKFRLLCATCEQRFGEAEREFATNIFSPFHNTDQDHFSYGPWLHYYMTSLAWRTLILDLPGLEADAANPRATVAKLAAAAETMRLYLLGGNELARLLRNHAFVFTTAHSGSAELASAGPNVMIRRSVFGYSILHRLYGHSGIIHNLAGFMCFLIVKGNPRDTWNQTKINPTGGEIRPPQRVSSWLMGELLSCIVGSSKKQLAMSEAQQEKVSEAMRKNPSARAFRFRELDKGFSASE
ncbi:MAG: hypothetical protein V3T84_12575 [Phycisphaerales bacterium]